jgi:hypothetical protein
MKVVFAAAVAAVIAFPTMASAGHRHQHHDHGASAHEWKRLVARLHCRGFVKWEEAELDDGHWEIDDAIDKHGRQYDLKWERHSLRVIKSKRER